MPRLQNSAFVTRGAEISFEMDGIACIAIEGETIAAALLASGRLRFKRGRHGEARGYSCGMGVCFECEVSIDGGTPARACMTRVRAGMQVSSTEYRKPLPKLDAPEVSIARERIDAEVIVIGGGPAGMAAAADLSSAGVPVVLVDERADLGGQFYKQPGASQDYHGGRPTDAQYAEGLQLIERLRSSNTRVLGGATAWGSFRTDEGSFETGVTSQGKSYLVCTQAMLVASGAYESMPAFPGWTLPGVMSTGAAQSLARAYRVAPGDRVVIAGNGPLNFQLACELLAGGVRVLAVAEAAPFSVARRLRHGLGLFAADARLAARGLGYLATLRRHAVPVLYGSHIARAEGRDELEAVALAPISRTGEVAKGPEHYFPVDALCVGYGLQPSNDLIRALGCTHTTVSAGVTRPLRNDHFETDVPGVFAVGDGAALGGAQVALAEARIAAAELAARYTSGARRDVRTPRRYLERQRRFQRRLWALFAAPEYRPIYEEALICRCESVSIATVRKLVADGVRDFGHIKRCTRAGMGSCQGRYCQRHLANVVAEKTGAMPAAEQLFEARFPVKPLRIDALVDEKPDWTGYRTLERILEAPSPGELPHAPHLEADVLVIGAGIIGLTTARALARRGVDVLVVDRTLPMSQASGTNAGSLHGQLLSSDFGLVDSSADPTGSTLKLQILGIEAWQALEKELQANFELQLTGGLVVAGSDDEKAFLERKAAFERGRGLDVELLSASQLRDMLPCVSPRMLGAAYCRNEGKINPLAAGPVILAAAQRSGIRLLSPGTVLSIERQGNAFEARTDRGVIRCEKIVNAAGGWAAGVAKLVGTTLPVRTAPQQMIVTEPLEPAVPLLVAAAGRHLTLKQVRNGNLIIGGGWPASFDRERDRAGNLRDSIEGNLWVAQQVIPGLAGVRMLRSWATVGVMIDGTPILGEDPGVRGMFNCVGANGYTMGPILGSITAGLVLGESAPIDIRPLTLERFS